MKTKLFFILLIDVFHIVLFFNVPSVAHGQNSSAPLSHSKACDVCSEMIFLPSGEYLKGATEAEFKGLTQRFRLMYEDETPARETIVKAFSLAAYDVTRKQFQIFVKETGFKGKGCTVLQKGEFVEDPNADWENPGFKQTDQDPVVCVSWNDAQKFVEWLNIKQVKQSSQRYRLPTEAEWEYAARAGTTTANYWGNNRFDQCKYENALDLSSRVLGLDVIDKQNPFANCNDGFIQTSPVGMFRPNPWGFFDMLGNAYQWMEDCPEIGHANLTADPPRSNKNFCLGIATLRGGSWISVPFKVRAAFRSGAPLALRESTTGFRLASDIQH